MKKILRDPILLVMLTLTVFILAVFIIYPLINVFIFPDIKDYFKIFRDQRYLKSALNSLVIMIL
jgi:ABC-type sulfate transport system permease component